MTRTHKNNDVPHNHPEAEPAFQEHQVPKYFGKTGFADQAPNKVKKNGGGKGNWGRDGGEIEDIDDFNAFKPRRRSNSMSHHEDLLPSKFDINETEPVFEEEIHGPGAAEAVSTTSASASSSSGSPSSTTSAKA